ncbi:SgcJ/EcaC family oxidoreductase [Nocardioides sp. W7]|uniref:YybH family protein n=1 Tax=Nocardioides sp. W7 TaxID=2931390 RepID=UPI001FD0AA96|nr:SgcJ/EcaC family oxidoreductase [Nocardioides sp. W7]
MNATAPAEITALLDDVAAGITARDPDRCVARFAPDARSVIANGARAVGRDAIRAAHVAAFAAGGPPKSARFAVLDLHLPWPGLAIVTTGAYAAGAGDEVDLDRPPTVVTWTLLRADDGWWVAARQFTPVAG